MKVHQPFRLYNSRQKQQGSDGTVSTVNLYNIYRRKNNMGSDSTMTILTLNHQPIC